jgi:hypothetical protein
MRLLLTLSLVLTALSGSSCSQQPPSRTQSPESQLTGQDFKPTQPTELVLSEADQRSLLAAARELCDGNPLPEVSGTLSALRRDIIPVLYATDGTRAASQRLGGDEPTLARLVKHLPALCRQAPNDARLHLLVVGYNARLPNFGVKGIFDQKLFEPMVTGLVYNYNGRRSDIDPLKQLERNLSSKATRTALAWAVGLDPKRAPAENALTLEIYRALHIGETRTTGAFSRFFRGHQPLVPEDLTHALIDRRLHFVADWYRNNVIDGEVTYEFSPATGQTHNAKRTMVRSTMSIWILNRLAQHLQQDDLKALGQLTLDHTLDTYFQRDQTATPLLSPSPVALENGNLVRNRWTAASFIAAAILERPDWQTQRQEFDLLMRFAMSYKRDDNLLWTDQGSGQFFMPGQLLLAVAYAYRHTHDPAYRQFFDAVFDTYTPVLLQMMHLGPKTTAPYAPAWFTQPAAVMYSLTQEPKYRDLIYAINDRVVLNYQRNAAFQVYEDYDGMLAPKLGSYGNNSITAAALESLVDAAITARADEDTARFQTYMTAIRPAVAFLLRLQFTPDNAYYMKNPDRVIGGFKKDMVNSVSWMDNVWHFSSALMKIQDAKLFEERDGQ